MFHRSLCRHCRVKLWNGKCLSVLTTAFTKKASLKIGDRPWRHSSTKLLVRIVIKSEINVFHWCSNIILFLGHPLAQNERCLHMFLQVISLNPPWFSCCDLIGGEHRPELCAWQGQKHLKQPFLNFLSTLALSPSLIFILLIYSSYQSPSIHVSHLLKRV